MGSYLNPGSIEFQECLNSEIYVDKTGLLVQTNRLLRTKQKFVCISRPRRFGKSMAADMLAAYYGRGENTEEFFRGLKISEAPTFHQHLNHYVAALKEYHGNLLLAGINYDKKTKKHSCKIEKLKL